MEESQKLKTMEDEYNQLVVLYRSKKFNELLVSSKKFVKKYPQNIYGANILGLAYKNIGDFEKAIELYELLMKSGVKEPSIYTNAGNAYYSIGKVSESLLCHKKALDIDPNAIGSLTGCGLALYNEGKEDEAIEYYKRVPEIDPSDTSSYYNIGNILRNQEKYKEAADYYSKHLTKISKAQELECIYRLEDIEKFDQKLEEFESEFGSTPLAATISAHASIKYSRADKCQFAPNAFELIEKVNLIESQDLDNDFITNFIKDFNSLSINKKTQSLLSNGFQTSGNLFLHEKESIKILKDIIYKNIQSYRDQFSHTNFKIFTEWPSQFEIYAWMILIGNQGSLNAHMHKEGWLSGSLYINIPEKEEDSNAGDIRFSLNGGAYKDDGKKFPEKIVDLKTADMVLFPSSLFHSTIPFNSTKNRITLAFDVRPPNLDTIL